MANTDSGAPAMPARRTRPIVLYLVVLALVAFVPVMAFSAVLLQRNNAAQQEVVQTLIRATTGAVGEAVDRQIDGVITSLKGFASAPMATDDDLRQLHDRGQSVLAGTGTFLTLIDSNFNALFNTRFPYGTPMGKGPNAPMIQRAIDTGTTIVSDVVYGPVVKAWVIPIFMPVTLPGGRKAVLGITQNADNLGSELLTRQMPEGWRVALLDSQNKVIAATANAGIAQGSDFFIAPERPAEDGPGWRRVTVNGHELVAVASTSPKTGWSVAAWAPAAAIERPLSNSLLTLIIGGLVIVAAATIATFLLSREISRSVRGLARDARRLGAGETVPTREYPVSEIADVAGAIAAAARQRQAAETEVRFLMRELAHRSKNQMTVIAAMAKQTARGADSVPEFVASFERRIFGLARSTDLLLANGIAGVDLRELLGRQIDPFCPIDDDRVAMDGPALRLNTQAAQIIGMAGHELATNAAKYGAFSGDEGRLVLSWRREADRLILDWREHVKVLPARSDRRGFGTTVLENMVGSALGATVTRTLHEDGIEWNFDIPMSGLDPNHGPDSRGDAAPRPVAA